MPDFHVRLNDEQSAQLDRLTAAVRKRYEHMAITIPRFADIARNTTRSSAIRDLLAAWDHGNADTAFNTNESPQDA